MPVNLYYYIYDICTVICDLCIVMCYIFLRLSVFSVSGVTGRVMIGPDGDREPEYVLKQFRPGDTKYVKYGEIFMGIPGEEVSCRSECITANLVTEN